MTTVQQLNTQWNAAHTALVEHWHYEEQHGWTLETHAREQVLEAEFQRAEAELDAMYAVAEAEWAASDAAFEAESATWN
ncbi:hypothetical protein D3C81_350390 [compost metagenome]